MKLVYFNDYSGKRQSFWKMPDGSLKKADKSVGLYLKDRDTGLFRLIQG